MAGSINSSDRNLDVSSEGADGQSTPRYNLELEKAGDRAAELVQSILLDRIKNSTVQELYEELVTREMLTLDKIKLEGCNKLRLRRKQIIDNLDMALRVRTKNLNL